MYKILLKIFQNDNGAHYHNKIYFQQLIYLIEI